MERSWASLGPLLGLSWASLGLSWASSVAQKPRHLSWDSDSDSAWDWDWDSDSDSISLSDWNSDAQEPAFDAQDTKKISNL